MKSFGARRAVATFPHTKQTWGRHVVRVRPPAVTVERGALMSASPTLVARLLPGPGNGVGALNDGQLAILHNGIAVFPVDAPGGARLYRSDGTPQGTFTLS